MNKKAKDKIERILLTRLKWISYIFYLWGFGFFFYALIAPPAPSSENLLIEISELPQIPKEFSPHDFFNFFFLSILFFGLGVLCHYKAAKKQKTK
jgi:hypothetical protein